MIKVTTELKQLMCKKVNRYKVCKGLTFYRGKSIYTEYISHTPTDPTGFGKFTINLN